MFYKFSVVRLNFLNFFFLLLNGGNQIKALNINNLTNL